MEWGVISIYGLLGRCIIGDSVGELRFRLSTCLWSDIELCMPVILSICLVCLFLRLVNKGARKKQYTTDPLVIMQQSVLLIDLTI